MDSKVLEINQPPAVFRLEKVLRSVVHAITRIARRDQANLDFEVMSDYLKRDLGFLDGRDPRQDSDLTR